MYEERVGTHLEQCPKRRVKCPNRGCNEEMYASDVDRHTRQYCKYREVECRYKMIGCTAVVWSKDICEHERNASFHLGLAMDAVAKLQEAVKSFHSKHDGVRKDLNSAREDLASVGQLKENHALLQGQIVSLGDQTASLLSKLDSTQQSTQTNMAGFSRRLSSMQRELESVQRELASMCEAHDERNEFKLLQRQVSALEGKIEQEKTVENGKLTFKLTDYLEKKANDEIFHSPPFYTSQNGYKMFVKVYTNGDGADKGTYLSAYAPILEGKNDAELKWPFTGSIVIELLNQMADQNHNVKKVSIKAEDNALVGAAWGYSKFILTSKLPYSKEDETQYLDGDTLYFRVSVDVGLKPWLECNL